MDPVTVFNALFDTKCIKFGQYKLKSGLVAPYYINLRRLPLYPKLFDAIVTQVVDKFNTDLSGSQANAPILCGVPYGAIPLASAIAFKARLPYLLERQDAKSYGDQQCLMEDFEGKQQRVILIDDVICSGESILNSVKSLERRNLRVEFVICIIDREQNGIKLLLESNIRVVPLYNMSAIFRVLETTGRISRDEFIQTSQWISKNQFISIGVGSSEKCSPTKSVSTNDVDQHDPKSIPLLS